MGDKAKLHSISLDVAEWQFEELQLMADEYRDRKPKWKKTRDLQYLVGQILRNYVKEHEQEILEIKRRRGMLDY